MSRKKAFAQPKAKNSTPGDSRFGVRKFYLNDNEKPSIHVPQRPGRGVRGEHQN